MNLKYFVFGILILISSGLLAGDRYTTISEYRQHLKKEYPRIKNWMFSLNEAAAKAQKEKKNLIVYFSGGNDCPACRRLRDSDFKNNNEFYQTLNDHYIIVYQPVPIGRVANSFFEAPLSVQENKRNYENQITKIETQDGFFGVPEFWIFEVDQKSNSLGWVYRKSKGTKSQFHKKLIEFIK